MARRRFCYLMTQRQHKRPGASEVSDELLVASRRRPWCPTRGRRRCSASSHAQVHRVRADLKATMKLSRMVPSTRTAVRRDERPDQLVVRVPPAGHVLPAPAPTWSCCSDVGEHHGEGLRRVRRRAAVVRAFPRWPMRHPMITKKDHSNGDPPTDGDLSLVVPQEVGGWRVGERASTGGAAP